MGAFPSPTPRPTHAPSAYPPAPPLVIAFGGRSGAPVAIPSAPALGWRASACAPGVWGPVRLFPLRRAAGGPARPSNSFWQVRGARRRLLAPAVRCSGWEPLHWDFPRPRKNTADFPRPRKNTALVKYCGGHEADLKPEDLDFKFAPRCSPASPSNREGRNPAPRKLRSLCLCQSTADSLRRRGTRFPAFYAHMPVPR